MRNESGTQVQCIISCVRQEQGPIVFTQTVSEKRGFTQTLNREDYAFIHATASGIYAGTLIRAPFSSSRKSSRALLASMYSWTLIRRRVPSKTRPHRSVLSRYIQISKVEREASSSPTPSSPDWSCRQSVHHSSVDSRRHCLSAQQRGCPEYAPAQGSSRNVYRR